MGSACPHLHARSFATEREPGADCEQTAEELYPDKAKRRAVAFPRATRPRRGGYGCRTHKARVRERARLQSKPPRHTSLRHTKSCEAFVVCLDNQSVTPTVCVFESKPEDRPHKSGCRTDRKGQGRAPAGCQGLRVFSAGCIAFGP